MSLRQAETDRPQSAQNRGWHVAGRGHGKTVAPGSDSSVASAHASGHPPPGGGTGCPAIAEIWRRGWADGHLGNVPDALVAIRTPETFQARTVEGLGAHDGRGGRGDRGRVRHGGRRRGRAGVRRRQPHRGSGVAGVMLGRGRAAGGGGGVREAWLAVAPGNARARRFYERSGWSDAGMFDYLASSADGPIPVPCHRYIKAVGYNESAPHLRRDAGRTSSSFRDVGDAEMTVPRQREHASLQVKVGRARGSRVGGRLSVTVSRVGCAVHARRNA